MALKWRVRFAARHYSLWDCIVCALFCGWMSYFIASVNMNIYVSIVYNLLATDEEYFLLGAQIGFSCKVDAFVHMLSNTKIFSSRRE